MTYNLVIMMTLVIDSIFNIDKLLTMSPTGENNYYEIFGKAILFLVRIQKKVENYYQNEKLI